MEKDRRSDHSDVYTEGSAFDPGAPFPIKDDRPLSYFNDPEARAWERKFFAPDPGLDLTDRKEQKEARDLLWKADISTAMPPLKISDRKQRYEQKFLSEQSMGNSQRERIR